MSRRAGLTPSCVVATALVVMDELGPDGMTLTAVAERARVATPSLYKHVRGLSDLRNLVAVQVRTALGADLRQAIQGRSGDDAVTALLRAYRSYATRHPHRYAALTPVADDARDEGDGPDAFAAALRGHGLDTEELRHAARCLRIVAHGFASLETGGGFGLSVDAEATHVRLAALFCAGLRTRSAVAAVEPP